MKKQTITPTQQMLINEYMELCISLKPRPLELVEELSKQGLLKLVHRALKERKKFHWQKI
jgi:hypothetical protein